MNLPYSIKPRKLLLGLAIVMTVMLGALTYTSIRSSGENQKVSGEPSTVSKNEAAHVTIKEGGAFYPATLGIKVGTMVKWTSEDDDLNHHLVAGPHPQDNELPDLSSPTLGADEVYTYTFTKAGTYHIHDEIHPELTNTIIVTP